MCHVTCYVRSKSKPFKGIPLRENIGSQSALRMDNLKNFKDLVATSITYITYCYIITYLVGQGCFFLPFNSILVL